MRYVKVHIRVPDIQQVVNMLYLMSDFTDFLKDRTNIKQKEKPTGIGFMSIWERSDQIL